MTAEQTPKPTRKQLREFGFLIGLAFPILIGWLFPYLRGHAFLGWTIWIAIPALVLAIAFPQGLASVYRVWMAIGHGLGWINSHIILGIIFYFVLLPIATLARAFGHDPLHRTRHNGPSYREGRNHHKINLKQFF